MSHKGEKPNTRKRRPSKGPNALDDIADDLGRHAPDMRIVKRKDGKAVIENEVCLGEGQNPVFKIKHGNTYVAAKVICGKKADDKSWLEDAKLEYDIAAKLSNAPNCHKHVVCMYDEITESVDREPVYVMLMELTEGVAGDDEDHQNYHKKPWTLAQTKRYLLDMVEGLAYIHGQGIGHMDIKPPNMMMVKGDHIKYADFGLACRRRGKGACRSGTGSPLYAAPEFLDDKGWFRDHFPNPRRHLQWADLDLFDMFTRADVFALGVSAYEMIHNRHAAELGVDAHTMHKDGLIVIPKSSQTWPRWGRGGKRPPSAQLPGGARNTGPGWSRVYRLLDSMLDVDPMSRPPAAKLVPLVKAL